ncbi:succinyldiaminopimelate transaminase [Flaviflexus salsibiostraticola]|uniref:Succinyldiaminopimelate transaminase n=1 Tax=Flaviflexus salsibiostraticola TaxID=1282737 RepID=A0A3Q8WV46_9ACTO|nr:succinyldiaminopimelate transaminase [Flaviflexus salsibiostraticola]AZN30820.1 succinyldiaminopimelate transaminase [Flaviflexus salsibiostraticola]
MPLLGEGLPDFPWDTLTPFKKAAYDYPGITADLSIGTPVDPTPQIAIDALRASEQSPGYPPALGTPELRAAMVNWWSRTRGASVPLEGVLPTIGSKEMVALLPSLLGIIGHVLIPEIAYPTYDVGTRLSGATPIPIDTASDPATWPDAELVWLNSPSNPHGHVLDREQLRRIVDWGRATETIIASDECYAALPWAEPYVTDGVPSILADDIAGEDKTGLLALYSSSKQSNLAGYRAAMIAGDPRILAPIIEVRKHMGFLMPGPVQAAMTAILSDDTHVAEQREIYRRRRDVLLRATAAAGLTADPETKAGLYLWLEDESGTLDAWGIVKALSERGILVAPGTFYGQMSRMKVRMSLTATDEAVDAAAERLASQPLV